jgi:exopolysaccharide production protein ExoQ
MIARIQSSLILGYLVGLVAFAVPILGFIAPKGLAPLVFSGAVCGFVILKLQKRPVQWLNRPVVVILICLCLWTALSVFWSINNYSAIIGTIKMTGSLIVGGVLFSILQSLSATEVKMALRWMLAGFVFILVVVIVELIFSNPIFSYIRNIPLKKYTEVDPYWLNTLVAVLALLVWPAGLAIVNFYRVSLSKKRAFLLVVGGISAVFLLAISIKYFSGAVALSLGIVGASIIWLFGRPAAIVISILLVAIGLSSPFMLTKYEISTLSLMKEISLPFSALHRIQIWEFTANKIKLKTFSGWGMNASRDMPDGKTVLRNYDGYKHGEAIPLHPHNAMLQIWLEQGLPGIILYLGLSVFIIMSSVRRHRSKIEASFMFGQFVTMLTIANLSFGIWQSWWMAALWLAAATMVMISKYTGAVLYAVSTENVK